MLRWRLILGAVYVLVLGGACWLDAQSRSPGLYLGPIAVVVTWFCADELRKMFDSRGYKPAAWSFYSGALMPVIFSCVPIAFPAIVQNYTIGTFGWLGLGLAAGLAVAFVGEMQRFDGAGRSIVNVAVTTFAVLYVGGCMGMIVQLRLVHLVNDPESDIGGFNGLFPLLAFVATVKFSDICQYAVGRTFGRNKLAPKLSPGKTWEGAVGGIAVASVLSAAFLGSHVYSWKLFEWHLWPRPLFIAASIAVAGLIGDLAESLLKRDAGMKDSSNWMPGFGGVLDLMDSLLLAAPLAYLWFVNGFLDPVTGTPAG